MGEDLGHAMSSDGSAKGLLYQFEQCPAECESGGSFFVEGIEFPSPREKQKQGVDHG